jgi:hypothetical protein
MPVRRVADHHQPGRWGTERAEPIELPWLDVDKALLFAASERPGDDVAVALATGLTQRTRGLSRVTSGPNRDLVHGDR